jgi:two-component sensor histidine kinase
MRDITEQRTAEDQIRASLQEKEVLLKEIHHRVKNNLQVIVSLLSLQSEYLAGSGVLTTLEDMKNRVRSIAAIHEMLYGSADLSRVDFAAYLDSIAQDLASFYAESAHRIRLLVNSENISLDITQAVPCGLIVNEILTNSFKHAFPNNRSGSIEVAFRCVNEECILEIADNGIGLPENVEPQKSSSMGLQLLALLVRQLRGRLETHRDSGARFVITFRQKPTEPQP